MNRICDVSLSDGFAHLLEFGRFRNKLLWHGQKDNRSEISG
jgi:hypothetical protein